MDIRIPHLIRNILLESNSEIRNLSTEIGRMVCYSSWLFRYGLLSCLLSRYHCCRRVVSVAGALVVVSVVAANVMRRCECSRNP